MHAPAAGERYAFSVSYPLDETARDCVTAQRARLRADRNSCHFGDLPAVFASPTASDGYQGVPTHTPPAHAPAPPGPAPAPAPGTPAVAPPGPAPAPAPPAPASAPPGPAPAPAPGTPAVAPPGPAPAPGAGAPVPGAGAGVVAVVAAGLDVVVDVVSDVLVSSPLSSPPPHAVSVNATAAAAIPVVTEKRRKIKRSVMVQSRFL